MARTTVTQGPAGAVARERGGVRPKKPLSLKRMSEMTWVFSANEKPLLVRMNRKEGLLRATDCFPRPSIMHV
ncbi:hypothetical protein CapIbe_018299 [Capra ibex]